MTASADVIASLQARFSCATVRPSADHPAINVPITGAAAVLQALRDESGYDLLVDVTAIDNGVGVSPRFTVVWHVLATARADYVRIAADCLNDSEPVAPSVSHLWPAANWHERETWDLLGVSFENHPDPRRILMWEGYPGHPLRKDFPLAGVETGLPDPEVAAVTGTPVVPAPMVGGPFVASSGKINLTEAEPRAKDESWSERSAKPRLHG
jgi:NADH-quinone oxidoreductase subunit C